MKKQLDEKFKLHIIDLNNKNYTHEEISKIHSISTRTIIKILNRYKETGSVKRKTGSGRPLKYQVDDILHSLLKDNNNLTINQMIRIIETQKGIKCSHASILERLHKLGYEKKEPIFKPLLSERHLNDREYWGIFYQNYDWASVIWSDESSISIQPNKYSKIWIHKENPIIKRKVKYPLRINVWGCILWDHKLCIHIFKGSMTGEKYINVLKLKLIPLIEKHKNTKKLLFQQDNAPCHTCFKSLEFFSKNNIETMFWPANSPDLNPIENIWNLLKRKIGAVCIKTEEELINTINEASKSLKISIINNLIDSMDDRIEELFNNNFDSINY